LTTPQILFEIEQKSIQSSQQITLVKQQIATKNREGRKLQLTATEVGALPRDTHVYEGVGKMYVVHNSPDFYSLPAENRV
jgi:prefoldin subunit 1